MKAQPAALDNVQFGFVAASVLVAVLPHLVRLPLAHAGLVLVVFAMRCVQRARHGRPIPAALKLPLIVIFPLFIIFHYGNIFGREPGSALASAMLVLKLAETETRRDALACICFASFVLMSALLFGSGLGFALLLFAALALLLGTLRELEPRPLRAAPRAWRDALRRNLRAGGFSLLAAVPLALCVFVFFPRLGSPLWGAPTDSTAHTGLGDRMAPGAIQELLIDDTPAFRVTFDTAPPPRAQLYWRGPVLWSFDGTAWTRPDYIATPRQGAVQATGSRVSYEVMFEPTDRHWLVALDVPLMAPDGATRSADMSLVTPAIIDHLMRYRVTSAPRYKLDPELDRMHRHLALALPEGFNPRARALAQRWREQLGTDEAIIGAALEFFHKSFFYTLSPPELGRDSVDDFLFSTQKGFCEHFSSAFTFLMRAAGIPARVVTGYQGGYYNDVGGYLVVRQSDAHAWSEVWLDGRGWVRVDPTGAVSPLRVQLGARAAAGETAPWYQAGWLQTMRNQFDLVNRVWNDAIVQFNALRQQNLLAPLGIEKADYSQLMLVLIAVSSCLLGVLAWWTLRRPAAPVDPLDGAYARLCRKLARVGAVRLPHEGPRRFAERLGDSGYATPALRELLEQYARLRYACDEPPRTAVAAFSSQVAALRVHAAASAAE